jgi:hypothetical protein
MENFATEGISPVICHGLEREKVASGGKSEGGMGHLLINAHELVE